MNSWSSVGRGPSGIYCHHAGTEGHLSRLGQGACSATHSLASVSLSPVAWPPSALPVRTYCSVEHLPCVSPQRPVTWAVSHPFSDEEADLTLKSPAGRAPLGSRPSDRSSRRLGLLTPWAFSPGCFPEGWTQDLSLPGPPPTSHPEPLLGPLLTASQGRQGPTLAEPPAHPPC